MIVRHIALFAALCGLSAACQAMPTERQFTEDMLRRFRAPAEDCRGQQRCISPNIYRFRDGFWKIAN